MKCDRCGHRAVMHFEPSPGNYGCADMVRMSRHPHILTGCTCTGLVEPPEQLSLMDALAALDMDAAINAPE